MAKKCRNIDISGLYYKPMMIVDDDSRVVNKLEASLTDDARVIIYDRHMFIVQTTGCRGYETFSVNDANKVECLNLVSFLFLSY